MFELATLSRIERRLLARLERTGAISLERAHPLPDLPKAPAGWRERLIARGLLGLTPEGLGFVDIPRYRAALRAWRTLLVVMVAALVIPALLLLSCTPDPEIPGRAACRSGAAASASPGLTPIFSWQPADCTVGSLTVLDSAYQPTWIVTDSAGQNGLSSGITYGTRPPRGRIGPIFLPLSSGGRYTLVLRLQATTGAGVLVDTLSFVP